MDNLNDLLRYEPETGKLFWKKRPIEMFAFDPTTHNIKRRYSPERACNKWNTRYADKEALTTLNNWGYRHGSLHGQSVLAHRVIWKMVTGHWPNEALDHINGDRADNRLVNLREASPTLNSSNRAIAINNKSGVIGVFWNLKRKRWQAQISLNGKQHNLGLFNSKEEAKAARRAAEEALKFAGRQT
jgi:HNH endonuclease